MDVDNAVCQFDTDLVSAVNAMLCFASVQSDKARAATVGSQSKKDVVEQKD